MIMKQALLVIALLVPALESNAQGVGQRPAFDDARIRAVGQPRSTREVPEQSRATGGGGQDTRVSTPRSGHRAGMVRPARWREYGK